MPKKKKKKKQVEVLNLAVFPVQLAVGLEAVKLVARI
ncbi:hypothetical protein LCGC14_0990660 [marine sediment metagenome]|uniref:Uncharacterized protein n=1 Tax=marine sediment metagenome TaxID=412755 RepID=A0A0F9QPB6_9ZZZZ